MIAPLSKPRCKRRVAPHENLNSPLHRPRRHPAQFRSTAGISFSSSQTGAAVDPELATLDSRGQGQPQGANRRTGGTGYRNFALQPGIAHFSPRAEGTGTNPGAGYCLASQIRRTDCRPSRPV